MGEKIRFIVPTGNFGNVLAGYFAQKMGLPIDKLVGKLTMSQVWLDLLSILTYIKWRRMSKLKCKLLS
jgi:threonine synthase